MMNEPGLGPLQRRPTVRRNGERPGRSPARARQVPADMDDLAYLVNQVQHPDPPIFHAHARFADDKRLSEPTVHIYNTDNGELIWRLPLTELVLLAARFFRLNPGLILSERAARPAGRAAERVAAQGELEPQPLPAPPGMNDLAYLANQIQERRRPVQQARAQLLDGEADPTVLVVDSATEGVLLGLPLTDLLRLARYLRLDTGLVFQGQG